VGVCVGVGGGLEVGRRIKRGRKVRGDGLERVFARCCW
jgi:hypothetical protein